MSDIRNKRDPNYAENHRLGQIRVKNDTVYVTDLMVEAYIENLAQKNELVSDADLEAFSALIDQAIKAAWDAGQLD